MQEQFAVSERYRVSLTPIDQWPGPGEVASKIGGQTRLSAPAAGGRLIDACGAQRKRLCS